MEKNEFKCAMCAQVFEKAWTDEEAMDECREDFGEVDADDCDVICDDCYQKIMGQFI